MASIDLSIFNFFHSIAGKSAIFDLIIVFFASYSAYLLIFLWVILFFKKKGFKKRFYFFSLTALSVILSRGIITEIIRFFYERQRPFSVLNFDPLIGHSASAAFPSGHMAFYFVLFMVVFYAVSNKRWAWWFLGFVVLMGLGRIVSGVHWPSDIIGGITVAFASSFLVYKVLPKLSAENNKADISAQ